jgi:hypothetical protein
MGEMTSTYRSALGKSKKDPVSWAKESRYIESGCQGA